MRNGDSQLLPDENDAGPDLEAKIRAYLPDDVKQFALEKASVCYSWISLYKMVRDHGATETLRVMRRNNAVLQVEAYGPDFHRALSPWREY